MRVDAHTADDDGRPAATEPPEELFETGRPRRRMRRHPALRVLRAMLLTALAAVAAGLVLLPRILSTAWARQTFLREFNHRARDATLEIDDWTWRWFAPSRIDGLDLRTTDDTATLGIRSVTFSRGPAAWIGRTQRFGTVVVDQPVLTLIEPPKPPPPVAAAPPTAPRAGYRDPRKALRSPAAPAPRAPAPATPAGPPRTPLRGNPFGALEVRGGRIEAFPADSDPVRLSDLSLRFGLEGREGEVQLELSGRITPSARGATAAGGPLRLTLRAASLEGLATTPDAVGLTVRADVPSLDLALLDALLPPVADRPRLRSGLLTLALIVERSAKAETSVDARFSLRNLRIQDGRLGEHGIDWQDARGSLAGRAGPDAVHLDNAALSLPWLELRASGTGTAGTARKGSVTLDGLLDLPALLKDLDAILAGPTGITAPGGRLQLSAEGTRDDDGLRWFAQLQGLDLDAAWNDRPLPLGGLRLSAGGRLDNIATTDAEAVARNTLLNLRTPFARLQLGAGEAHPDGTARDLTGSLEIDTAPLREWAASWGVTLDPALPLVAPRLVATASADWTDGTLTLRSASVEAGPLGIEATGRWSDLHGARLVQLDGRTRADWDALRRAVEPLGRTDVDIAGRHEGPFALRMPLAGERRHQLAELTLDAALRADRLAGLGLEALQPELALHAAQGRLEPTLSATLNGGRLLLAPRIDGLASPPRLAFAPGSRVLDGVGLTDALIELLLARVHPVLKHATALDGTLALDLAEAVTVLGDDWRQQLRLNAAITLQGARLAPRGLLADVADALQLQRPELELPDQTLSVAVRDGRIHPQELTMRLGAQPLRAVGSVGLDGSLDYALELPVTPGLVGRQAFQVLEGRVLRVPIHGSAADPRIDRRALERELRSLLAAVATESALDAVRDRLRDRLRPDDARTP